MNWAKKNKHNFNKLMNKFGLRKRHEGEESYVSESRDAVDAEVSMACVGSSEVTDQLEQRLTLEAGGDMVG